jgi:hypothetical protein
MKETPLLSRRGIVLLPAGIIAASLALRLWGIGFGLPHEYHVDEVQYVRQAASLVETRLQPVWWNNPPFYKYIYLAEYGVLFVVGRLAGWYSSVGDFASKNSLNPALLYLIGRATTAIVGSLTVALAYWLGKAAYNRRVGLVSAALLGSSFIHVRDSHFAVNDIAATFFVTLSLVAAIGLAQTGRRRWYVLAGVALGLGFATKYSAILGAVPVLIAHLYSPNVRWRPRLGLGLRLLALVAFTTVAAAIVGSPYFVLTPAKVVRDAYEALYLAGRNGFDGWVIDSAGGYVFYLKTLIWGLGWPLFALTLMGLLVAIVRHFPKDVIIFSLPIAIFLVAGQQRMFFARFILPAVPALIILGAALLEKVVASVTLKSRVARLILAVFTLVIITQPLLSSIRLDYLLNQTDTRTLAKNWIETNIAADAKIAMDWPVYGPPLATLERAVPDAQRVYNVTYVGRSGLSDHPLSWYRKNGYDYLIASSLISEIGLANKEQDIARRDFYESLPQELALMQTVAPTPDGYAPPFIFDEIYGPAVSLWQRERPGPTLKIYRLQ